MLRHILLYILWTASIDPKSIHIYVKVSEIMNKVSIQKKIVMYKRIMNRNDDRNA